MEENGERPRLGPARVFVVAINVTFICMISGQSLEETQLLLTVVSMLKPVDFELFINTLSAKKKC